MLSELHVVNLGVIEDARVDLEDGMTALTGETGAGKTLLVEALELLLGGRADPVLVRPGATEAVVEGRFVVGEEEIVLARALPASGRSRAWIDGRMAPAAALAEIGSTLLDLHGQHAQQSLFDPVAQRKALDNFGRIDTSPLGAALARRAETAKQLAELGGDERARAREADLLRYQLEEISRARIAGPDEDEQLATEEARLADAAAHREAAGTALNTLDGAFLADRSGTGAGAGAGAVDLLGTALAVIGDRSALAPLAERLSAAQAELSDIASDLRDVVESWEDDPERLAELQARRQLLRELSRKYGEGVAGILEYEADARRRLSSLEASEEMAEVLGKQLAEADEAVSAAEAEIGAARRTHAPRLAEAVQRRLRALAMPRARIEITIGEVDPGDDVSFGLGANPGEPVRPLSKVASGGELARTMLALRLVLSDAPPTMVFDEVDAGVGGEAATAVGAALAEVSRGHQVLVVTHLAQVAAFAGHQIGVTKEVRGGRTVAIVHELDEDQRVAELARMLSGRPESATARRHAEELLHAGAGASIS